MKGHDHHHHHHWIPLTIGILGNVSSVMMYLAPLETFWGVYRRKSTEGFHSAPYVAAHFSAMVWIYYAILRSNHLLLAVNLVGCVVETLYILLFILYAPNQPKMTAVKLVSATSFGGFISIFVLTHFFAQGAVRVEIIGWLCVALSCLMFAAPLSIMRQVMRTKSVEFMPFTLSFFLFLSATLWLVYGVLLHDSYIMVPNGVGVVLGMAQMIVYGRYKEGVKRMSSSEPNATTSTATPQQNGDEPTSTSVAENGLVEASTC